MATAGQIDSMLTKPERERQLWKAALYSTAWYEKQEGLDVKWKAARRRANLLAKAQASIERLIALVDEMEGDPDFEEEPDREDESCEDGGACEDEGAQCDDEGWFKECGHSSNEPPYGEDQTDTATTWRNIRSATFNASGRI